MVGGRVSLGWPLLEAVITEKSFESAAGVFQLRAKAAEFEIEKIIGGVQERIVVVIPPGLFFAGEAVYVHIFRLNHFEKTGTAMRAAPTAGVAAAVRRFGNGVVTDGVVDH